MEFWQQANESNEGQVEQFLLAVQQIPLLSPREIFRQLEELGYRGQAAGRRAVSLMAYRHVRRIKRIYLEGCPRDQAMPKSNYLLVGPTGCGKTHLVELLFQQILKIPTVVVDVTTYSETGYVGQDPNTILTRLVHAAEGNPLLASIGIVCLDEFDKLSSGQNNAVFAGAGTTKDVTGLGVQRELLKMLEASEVVVPQELTHSTFGEFTVMNTADISFIGSGAFSGLAQLLKRRGAAGGIGFAADADGKNGQRLRDDAIAVSLTAEEVEAVGHFQAYGFLPELIARFTRIVPFEALGADTLEAILNHSVIRRLEREFRDEGLLLNLDPAVIGWVVKQCLKRETGARGLNSVMTRVIEDAAFEAYANEDGGTVTVTLGDEGPLVRIE